MFCCLTASTARALLCIASAEFGIQVIVEAVVACPEPEHSLVPVRLRGSRGQPCCTVGACASTCCVAWPWGWSSPQGSRWTYPLAPLLCLPLLESQQPHCQARCSGMESITG